MAAKKSAGVFVSWPKPDFEYTVKTNKHFRRNFHGAMLYAHYELSAIELKKEVIKYLRSINPAHALLSRIADMHENRFATVGKYMYLLNHGCDIPDDIMPKLMPALEKVIYEEEARLAYVEKESGNGIGKEHGIDESAAPVKMVISIQDRIREKAAEVAGEVEGWIDDFMMDKKISVKTVEDFVNLYKSSDLKAPHMRYMQNTFERRAKEIEEAVQGKDKDLVEAYSNYTKAELKKFDTFHKNLLKACSMMQESAKIERAPRKKKLVSADKVVSRLKYKKDDKALGLVSLNPTQIIGSKEVWLYSVKTRKLAQYKALDAGGLGVKGASLLNYSPDSAEKTLRKPAEALADFKKASKVKLRTFLKDLTTVDIPCSGKLNEHHIILRIDK
jgi:hypothetical protein